MKYLICSVVFALCLPFTVKAEVVLTTTEGKILHSSTFAMRKGYGSGSRVDYFRGTIDSKSYKFSPADVKSLKVKKCGCHDKKCGATITFSNDQKAEIQLENDQFVGREKEKAWYRRVCGIREATFDGYISSGARKTVIEVLLDAYLRKAGIEPSTELANKARRMALSTLNPTVPGKQLEQEIQQLVDEIIK